MKKLVFMTLLVVLILTDISFAQCSGGEGCNMITNQEECYDTIGCRWSD